MNGCKVCCMVWRIVGSQTRLTCAHCGKATSRWSSGPDDRARALATQQTHAEKCIREHPLRDKVDARVGRLASKRGVQ